MAVNAYCSVELLALANVTCILCADRIDQGLVVDGMGLCTDCSLYRQKVGDPCKGDCATQVFHVVVKNYLGDD